MMKSAYRNLVVHYKGIIKVIIYIYICCVYSPPQQHHPYVVVVVHEIIIIKMHEESGSSHERGCPSGHARLFDQCLFDQ